MVQLTLKPPYPNRDAVGALRRKVMEHLLRERPSVGARLWTDEEIVQITHLSRSTVRRALDKLQKEGWIQRRAGSGTFAGARLGQFAGGDDPNRYLDSALDDPRPRPSSPSGLLRLGVLVFGIGDPAHDWYTPLVLEGISDAADEQRISVELLGNRDRDVDAISRRLSDLRPDVLACLARDPQQAFVIRDAQRLGIPCLLSGTPHMNLGLPGVFEDNRQGMKLAVEHLIAHGHRRIGLVMQWTMEPWFAQRHEAFLSALTAAGLEADSHLVHMLPLAPTADDAAVESTAAFIEQRRPTAVIAGSFLAMLAFDRLHASGRVRIPQDLSLITFEQDFDRGRWLTGTRPTAVRLPLRTMGRQLAAQARQVVQTATSVTQLILPCELAPGASVLEANA
jgi:DNA-binding LacI/PurR family transcriptional regulator